MLDAIRIKEKTSNSYVNGLFIECEGATNKYRNYRLVVTRYRPHSARNKETT